MDSVLPKILLCGIVLWSLAVKAEVENAEHDKIIVQVANFDPGNQTQIELPERCKASISVDNSLPNQYCQGNCVGYDSEYMTSEEFYSSCTIDNLLEEIGKKNEAIDLSQFSTCLSPLAPAASHIQDSFDVDFPASCQSACQDREDCVWFTVISQIEKPLRCLLLSTESLANPLALTASGDFTECTELFQGQVADCGFGSYMCLNDAKEVLSAMDYAMMDFDPELTYAVSGPRFCRGSSNNVGDSMCMAGYSLLKTYHDSGYVSERLENVFNDAFLNFHGMDHMKGAVTTFDLDQWNETFPDDQRIAPLSNVLFIDEILKID